MAKEETNPLNIIEEANAKTLDYFNKTYVSNLELVQNLKTELFELEVQIDTLEKTRELYTYQVDDRKNVFSPLVNHNDPSSTKGYQLALQIKDLEDAKERLVKKIETVENDISFFKEQVSMLSKASKCIHTVLVGSNHDSSENTEDTDDLIEFIETENPTDQSSHPYTMMMLEDYENLEFAKTLDQNVKQELISNLNKLDVLKWLLHSDIGRAQITLNEIHTSQQSILDSIEDVLNRLNYNIDAKQPIWDQINKLVEGYRHLHPECMIDSTCDCTEHDIELPSVITLRLINMLREIFDNIFKHSNANHVTSKVFISSRLIDVYVNDNGVGIPDDYLERSGYHSGLHKLHEVISQLDGKLQIQGDLISGTNVRFSFPIKK